MTHYRAFDKEGSVIVILCYDPGCLNKTCHSQSAEEQRIDNLFLQCLFEDGIVKTDSFYCQGTFSFSISGFKGIGIEPFYIIQRYPVDRI